MIEKFAKSKIFYEKWKAEKCNALAKVKPPLLIFEYESALQTHTIHKRGRRVSAASTLYCPAPNDSAFRFQTKNKPFANLPINGAVAVSKPIEGWISSVIGIITLPIHH